MTKVVLSLGLLAAVASAANAQESRFGVKAGVVAASLTRKNSDLDTRLGFQAGGVANFKLSDLLSIQPELLYSQKGYETKEQMGFKERATFHYIDLPVLLRINADGLFFEAGPQLGYLAGQKTTISGDGFSDTRTGTDGLNKLDFGYIAGLGYQLEAGMGLGIRYNGGLRGLAEGNGIAKNSVFQLQLGYLFGGQ